MKKSNFIIVFILFISMLSACKKVTIEDKIYDNIIYDIGNKKLYTSSAEKVKQKSNAQFISILYADLFQNAIPNKDLNELSILGTAIGDKQCLNQMLISNYMNAPGVIMPTSATMRSDINKFIDETYIRFYLRLPTATERFYFKNKIESDVNLMPEHVFNAFAMSNEYLFY
jgi:hypothetical protein